MSLRPSSSNTARRPASSASNRPSSSASAGPSSSVLSRPASSMSMRPSSSAGFVRRSTVSSRPESRTTLRLSFRHDYVSSRQASRLAPLYRSLVTSIFTGLDTTEDEDVFLTASDSVTRSLDQTIKPSGSADMVSVYRQLRGHTEKARVNSNDALAAALEHAQKQLRSLTARATDLDDEIQLSRLPNHLSLLLALSTPPESSTLQFAEVYEERRINPLADVSGLTWEKILAEEPFEGQHWEGVYGLPHGSVKAEETWDARSNASDSSTPSLSPWDDDDESEQELPSPASSDSLNRGTADSQSHVESSLEHNTSSWAAQAARYSYRYEVEDLQARQYWKPDWRINALTDLPLNIGDASTLGPALRRLLGPGQSHDSVVQDRYINEHDAVREVLLALQGIQNIMLTWVNVGPDALSFVTAPDAPVLLHLSSTAEHSILSSFAMMATTLEHLRKFVSASFSVATKGSSLPKASDGPRFPLHTARRSTRTLEAFADAIDTRTRLFDQWCASREEQMCRAQAGSGDPFVVSFLSLESALHSRFSESFTSMLDILRTLAQRSTRTFAPQSNSDGPSPVWTLPDLPKRLRPAAITSLLLDSLLLTIQDRTSMGDVVTSKVLVEVFCSAATPLWDIVYHWLKDGMPIPEVTQGAIPNQTRGQLADQEFFIEDNELPLLDPDFWREGFVLKDDTSESESRQEGKSEDPIPGIGAVPLFLQRVARHILEAGKAIGLLRALGVPNMTEDGSEEPWMDAWRPFKEVLAETSTYREKSGDSEHGTFVASTDDFSRMVYDELIGPCKRAKAVLTRVLVDDCDLWLHLTAMEDLYLMRKGDVMANYMDVLFARMDSKLNWDDFHFLNSSFADTVASSKWIDASLVRFSHRSGTIKSANIGRTVRAIEGLFIEYAVPFPLTYIFGPNAMQIYSSLFVFILQIRRAKNALEQILVKNADIMPHGRTELKVFYAMRGRLSWFVNALLNFVCTNVLHTQVLSFHNSFKKAASLDEMIDLHYEHLSRVESRCLLQRNTASLHRAIISVLDMTLHFSDCFIAFAGDVTHDISRHSITSPSFYKHRSRKQRRLQRNVIGFSQTLHKPLVVDSDSSSDSEADEDLASAVEPSFSASMTASISFVEESFVDRVGKMSSELDALVRFIRRGVESLASSTSEAASAFEIFAFALEDWDQ